MYVYYNVPVYYSKYLLRIMVYTPIQVHCGFVTSSLTIAISFNFVCIKVTMFTLGRFPYRMRYTNRTIIIKLSFECKFDTLKYSGSLVHGRLV